MGKKGEGFIGTTIMDTWTITKGGGNKGGMWGRLRYWGRVGGNVRKLYLNNNKNQKY